MANTGGKTETVTVALGPRSYPIIVGSAMLDDIGPRMIALVRGKRVGIVSDTSVWPVYGEQVMKSLTAAGLSVTPALIPAGEGHKTLDTVSRLLDAFLDARFDRESALIALGGGVVGDVTGFAAAILLRGVSFVQIPTTVVSQVDASVGGKTGVDHRRGKNLIGAFHQPSLVFIDVATLRTLPDREIRGGLAEVVKHAVVRDPGLFAHLETDLSRYAERTASPEAWVNLMATNCRIKADVVAKDERESGLREMLNYGHTIGHAVEALGDFDRFRHGEGVLIGMRVAGALARRRGMWSPEDERRQNALIGVLAFQEPPADFSPDMLWDRMRSDKKARAGSIRFVLPTRIGEVTVVKDIARDEFAAAWAEVVSARGISP